MKARGGLAFCTSGDPSACANCFPNHGREHFAIRKAHIQSLLSQVDMLVAPSAFLRSRYVAWGIPEWQIVVLDNGIELPVQTSGARDNEGLARNRFAYFGQIHPYKGLLQLLSAFERVASAPLQESKRPRLSIHGAHLDLNKPDYVLAFREALARCGDSVVFRGPYERREQSRLMAETDWVVVPSIWWENSPLVIEEALAARRPIICKMAENLGYSVWWLDWGTVPALKRNFRWDTDCDHILPIEPRYSVVFVPCGLEPDTYAWPRRQKELTVHDNQPRRQRSDQFQQAIVIRNVVINPDNAYHVEPFFRLPHGAKCVKYIVAMELDPLLCGAVRNFSEPRQRLCATLDPNHLARACACKRVRPATVVRGQVKNSRPVDLLSKWLDDETVSKI